VKYPGEQIPGRLYPVEVNVVGVLEAQEQDVITQDVNDPLLEKGFSQSTPFRIDVKDGGMHVLGTKSGIDLFLVTRRSGNCSWLAATE
jgi:hypothetical protein